MRVVLLGLALLFLVGVASAVDCPFSSGKAIEYCNVEIYPEVRLYGQEIIVNVSIGYMREYEPIEENTLVEFWFYNTSTNIKKEKFRTGKDGLVKYVPEVVGYYLVKSCEKSILIYVNTTCGDGVCGGDETRIKCAKDCGKCGDGICDSDEDENCVDCAVCGDGACTAGESRSTCIKDCVFCGDDICDYLEDHMSCPLDCDSGLPDGVCDGTKDDKCDPDCEPDEDLDCEVEPEVVEPNNTPENLTPEPVATNSEEGDNSLTIVVLMICVIVAVGTIIFVESMKTKRRKARKKASRKAKAETKKNIKAFKKKSGKKKGKKATKSGRAKKGINSPKAKKAVDELRVLLEEKKSKQ